MSDRANEVNESLQYLKQRTAACDLQDWHPGEVLRTDLQLQASLKVLRNGWEVLMHIIPRYSALAAADSGRYTGIINQTNCYLLSMEVGRVDGLLAPRIWDP